MWNDVLLTVSIASQTLCWPRGWGETGTCVINLCKMVSVCACVCVCMHVSCHVNKLKENWPWRQSKAQRYIFDFRFMNIPIIQLRMYVLVKWLWHGMESTQLIYGYVYVCACVTLTQALRRQRKLEFVALNQIETVDLLLLFCICNR